MVTKCYTLTIDHESPGHILEDGILLDGDITSFYITVGNKPYPLNSSTLGTPKIKTDKYTDRGIERTDYILTELMTEKILTWGPEEKPIKSPVLACILIKMMSIPKDVEIKEDRDGKIVDRIQAALRNPSSSEYLMRQMKLKQESKKIWNMKNGKRPRVLTFDESIEWDQDDYDRRLREIKEEEAELHRIEDERRGFNIRRSGAKILCPRNVSRDIYGMEYLVLLSQDGTFEIKITRPRITGGSFLPNILRIRFENIVIDDNKIYQLSVYDPRILLSTTDSDDEVEDDDDDYLEE